YGSHFCYTDRYPADNAHFLPDNFSDADAANRTQLINAYDNTIWHTDRNIAAIIDRLSALSDTHCALVYTSDHGEDIYDDTRQRFLHASPTPTYWQLHVPMIIWTSDSYADAYPDKLRAIRSHIDSNISSSASFTPTLLDMAGIDYQGFDSSKSVASGTYKPGPRIYINDRNKAVPLGDSGIKQIDIDMLKSLEISCH
ncbi:MAG: sulfatase-like hydrolase/transferase, partial [Muribaculaceae bacterium]|nr:sulfatase-like hydrolase/transferase [Muribaculaceae bacterium]